MNPANTIRKAHTYNTVSQRPYRDRVIHLLALKSYKKPELLARLQRDGVNQKDRNSLGIILQQVRSWSFCQHFSPPAIPVIIILRCNTPVFKLENKINFSNAPCFSINFLQMPRTASQHEERKEILRNFWDVFLFC